MKLSSIRFVYYCVIRAFDVKIETHGADYTTETVPESEIVRDIGSQTAIIGDSKDHSLTELMGRISGKQ